MAKAISELSDLEYAGPWRRLAAVLVDLVLSVLMGAVSFFVVYTLVIITFPAIVSGYFIFTNAYGGTLGKRMFGMRLVNAETGGDINTLRSFGRSLVSVLSLLALFLGYFWVFWDDKNRTWHDKAVGSVVVMYKPSRPTNA